MSFSGWSQAPYGLTAVVTREQASSILYDSALGRFYASVPGENAIYVVNEANGAVLGKIQVNDPGALALSPDGSALYVAAAVTSSTASGSIGYYRVSTALLRVVDYVPTVLYQATPNDRSLGFTPNAMPVSVAALASGKLLFVDQAVGIGGGTVTLSDPATRLSTALIDQNFYGGVLTGSRDGTTVVSAAINSASVQLEVRGGDGSSTAYLDFSVLNSSDIAITGDGQTIAVGGRYLFNNALGQMRTLPQVNLARSVGSAFSVDGTKLYVLTPETNGNAAVVTVYGTASLQVLGFVPLPVVPDGAIPQAIAAGASGKLLVTTASGLVEVDTSTLLSTLPNVNNGNVTLSPSGGLASGPAPTVLSIGNSRNPVVYFGSTAVATQSSSSTSVTVQPPAGTAGTVVPVSVLFNDGTSAAVLNGYSYGPVIQRMSATAGSSGGGTVVTVYGLGLGLANSFPTVTVGGAAATVTAVSTSNGQDLVTFTTPAGAVGAADVTLKSIAGTVTRAGGFQYCAHGLVSSLVPYQMVVDDARNQLYVADYATGSVMAVDGTTLVARKLFTPGAGTPTNLAMTPDGTTLLVLSYAGNTLDVVNLPDGTLRHTFIPNPGGVAGAYAPNNVVATARGTALVSLTEINILDGRLAEVDLTTGAVSMVRTGLRFGSVVQRTLFASDAAGDRVDLTYDGSLGYSGAFIDQWQAGADADALETNQESSVFQLGTDDAGDLTLQDGLVLDAQLNQFANLAPDSTLTARRNLVYGESMHSSGALAYVPTTLGVELDDVHHGNTVLSVGVPEGSLAGNGNLAVTHSGSRLYVAQKNGIGVFDLAVVPLSVGSLTPANGSASGGTTVLVRGSGFTAATTLTLDGQKAAVTVLDSTRLTFVTPAVSAAKVVLTVANGSVSYSLDLAFDASVSTLGAPVLTRLGSPTAIVGASLANVYLYGTNFQPGLQVQLNGSSIETQYLNGTTAFFAYLNIAGPGQQAVTAVNAPNTTVSNALYITTTSTSTSIGSLVPGSVPAGSGSFTIAIYTNYGLETGAVAYFNGMALASSLFGNYVYATVPAALVTTAGPAQVTVMNPGTGMSNALAFTITPAVVSLTLTPSVLNFGPVLVGNTATATATLTSTGKVSATLGAIATGSTLFTQTNNCPATLTQSQSCTITVTFLPTSQPGGNGTLSVASGGATVSSALAGVAGDLALYPGTAPSPISAGQSTTGSFQIVTYGTVPASTVQLACTSGLPAGAACQFSPVAVSLGPVSNSNQTVNVTVTISTSAGTRGMLREERQVWFAGGLLALGLAALRRRRQGRWLRLSVGLVLVLVYSCALVACGSGGGSSGGSGTLTGNTPAGSFPITVTTTSGGNVHTVPVTLTVN